MNATPRKPSDGGEPGPLVQDQGDHFRDAGTDQPGGGEAGADASIADDTIDRDALNQADYGGTREPTPPEPAPAEPTHEGGLSMDEADGGGRQPGPERDSDDDPDGTRARR